MPTGSGHRGSTKWRRAQGREINTRRQAGRQSESAHQAEFNFFLAMLSADFQHNQDEMCPEVTA